MAKFFSETVGVLKAGSYQAGEHVAFALSDAIGCKLEEGPWQIWSLLGLRTGKGIRSKTKEDNEDSVACASLLSGENSCRGRVRKWRRPHPTNHHA